jgi:hypothetical protein
MRTPGLRPRAESQGPALHPPLRPPEFRKTGWEAFHNLSQPRNKNFRRSRPARPARRGRDGARDCAQPTPRASFGPVSVRLCAPRSSTPPPGFSKLGWEALRNPSQPRNENHQSLVSFNRKKSCLPSVACALALHRGGPHLATVGGSGRVPDRAPGRQDQSGTDERLDSARPDQPRGGSVHARDTTDGRPL